ncbi:MAG: NAD(P)H-binding protein [Candidatus Heimdallarchaeota archaeon]|nr:NAD(P)H-binding protein [Candidatus Heimdallarchaeota archaeon]
MTILVIGGTGATGKLLLQQLLQRNLKVRAIVRSRQRVPEHIRDHEDLELIEGNLLDLTSIELSNIINGCTAIVSCLGHNITLKGIFGPPFRLVRDAVKLLTGSVVANESSTTIKFVLMNTTGNPNRDLNEKRSLAERIAFGLIRILVPPQADNEAAANFLRKDIGQDHSKINWVAVRPDSLIDEPEVSSYQSFASPTRSAIFDPGKTSRINVAHFMSELIVDDNLWSKWEGQMPVIYNT